MPNWVEKRHYLPAAPRLPNGRNAGSDEFFTVCVQMLHMCPDATGTPGRVSCDQVV
jgi:hypothetical protein